MCRRSQSKTHRHFFCALKQGEKKKADKNSDIWGLKQTNLVKQDEKK
jgi:hypothetical protein